MPDILQETFALTVPKEGGDEYVFKIPTIKYEIELGYRAADVRRRAYPEAGGSLVTADYAAVTFSRACAILELYLVKASTFWPYGFSDDEGTTIDFSKPPVIDFEKFPVECSELVSEIGNAFEDEVRRFRQRRHRDKRPAGT